MTVVNTETGEMVDRPTYGEVRESIETTKSHLERAAEQVVWQIEQQVWTVLGYDSWDEMREAEYKGAAVIVPRADRPELVARLRSTGLSQVHVASTLGVSQGTIAKDEGNSDFDIAPPATRTDTLGRTRPTSYTKTPAVPATTNADEAEAEPEAGGYLSAHQPPAPSADPIGDYIEGSQAVQDARYLTNFYKAITKASDYRVFDAERIGRIGNDEDMRTLELQAKSAVEFYEKAKRARSGLRVISGGKS